MDSRTSPFQSLSVLRRLLELDQADFRIPLLPHVSGYFEAHLYGDVGLSIHPDRMHLVSPEMLSWFPLFFPFKVSLGVASGKGV